MGELKNKLKEYRSLENIGPPIVEEGLFKYGVNTEKLKVGDIILTFGNNKKAKIVAAGTSGIYSHAILYTGASSIHAEPKGGVYTKNPQRLIFNSPEHLVVLRLKNQLSEDQFKKIKAYAYSWINAFYSVPQALLAPALGKSAINIKTDTQYCSRLVAQSYAEAGINIVKNADYCSPNDIFRSSELTVVPGMVNILNMEELRIAYSDDYNEKIGEATRAWLYKIITLSRKNKLSTVSRTTDVSDFLSNHPEYDAIVSKYIRETDYMDYISIDRDRNPYRYDLKKFIERALEGNDCKKMGDTELKGLIYELDQRRDNYSSTFYVYDFTKFEYHLIQHEIQKSLYKDALDRKKILVDFYKFFNITSSRLSDIEKYHELNL